MSVSGLRLCSVMVSTSQSVWVGWNSLVRPFHTGTPAYRPSSSTVDWAKPRYSIPSYIRPSTRAVSFIDSLCPVSYTHLRAHETRHDLVCRLLLEKKKKTNQ